MKNLESFIERNFNVNETLQLLQSTGSVYFSWGVSKKINFNDGGLLLKVNGWHYKKWVFITLAYNDTYTIRLIDMVEEKVDEIFTNIYFDQLAEVIDERIEKIDGYKF